jgi:NAD(P)-dependent dehydrogenase (short-subunit alcohol dehydrogenase family)
LEAILGNRVALITGGTRGIGFGIARHLAGEGLNLALCGRREEEAVLDELSELSSPEFEVLYCQADISDEEGRGVLVAAVREHFGRLNVLVNNAGIAPRERRDILDASVESFEEVLRVNLQGPYFLTQRVAKWMVEQRSETKDFEGCIVNISSVSAKVASPSRGEYCVSKAGVSMASRLWAVRLAEFEIPVFEVQPGVIATDMTTEVQEKYDRLIAEGLLLQPRWGTPDDVGKTVAALIRGDLPYSTGAAIPADGGLMIPRL